MYSLVLMAAVSGGPDVAGADTPAMVMPAAVSYGCTGVSACSGYGCSASVSYSCYGSGYGCGSSVAMPGYRYGCGASYSSGCYGSCTGAVAYSSSCYGSSCHGSMAPAKHGFLGIVDRLRARRAASAGCMGSSCHGTVAYSCHGSSCYGSSCYGSVASSGCYGSTAYSAGCIGVSYGATYTGAIYGAAVSPAYSGTGVISERVISEKVISPTTGGTTTDKKMPAVDTKGTDTKGTDKDKKTGGNEEGANIKFQLPANAKLYVDGRLTNGEGTERSFFTPPLAAGQKYFYDVKAEVVVEGKTISEEKRVIVQAGADLRETFPKLLAAAGNPANIASK